MLKVTFILGIEQGLINGEFCGAGNAKNSYNLRWCSFSLRMRLHMDLMMHAMLEGLRIRGIQKLSKLKDI